MPELAPLTIDLPDEAATLALGTRLAPLLQPGTTIYLSGELGAGKTTLARGLLRGLGFGGRVKSPTYALVELYMVSSLNLYHFDFYRFRDPEEWQEAGFRDLFNEANICLVEWPEMAQDLLPQPDVKVMLSTTPLDARQAQLKAYSTRGSTLLTALR
ncbi:MAG TPA: tRNA (adenosine(37)-N6)-threonylcarbamoyltransferase complex ATPase subunit type 1 TsaE [Usitatibacteraceae bacterium]